MAAVLVVVHFLSLLRLTAKKHNHNLKESLCGVCFEGAHDIGRRTHAISRQTRAHLISFIPTFQLFGPFLGVSG